MAQRLVSIDLTDRDQSTHGLQEHLTAELSQSWKIMSVTGTGAGVGSSTGDYEHFGVKGYVAGWVLVVLEK